MTVSFDLVMTCSSTKAERGLQAPDSVIAL
jgi:hypothetical protein